MNRKIIKILIIAIIFFGIYHYSEASFSISRPSTHNLGLVGHWTFDGKDVVNGVALDLTANGNNGNLINIATSTFYSIGKIGQGFNFDGTNDTVLVTDPAGGSLDFGTGDFSISAWVKTSITGVNKTIVGKRSSGSGVGYDFRLSNSEDLALYLKDVDDVSESTHISNDLSLADGRWHHVVVVAKRDSSAFFYADGDSSGSANITANNASLNNSFDFYLGAAQADNYFPGLIDDVRVYNRALSTSEVKSLYNQGSSKFNVSNVNTLKDGLVGYWTMDGGDTDWTTNTLVDKSGNGGTAYMQNMSTSTSPVIGKIGQGFEFDGVDDYASTTRINNNEITISAWAYKNANHFTLPSPVVDMRYYIADVDLREGAYIGLGHLNTYNCGAGATSGYLCATFITITTNGSTRTEKNSVFNLSTISKNGTSTQEWFHIAGTYNSTDGNQRLYVNGVLRDTDLHTAGNTIVPYTNTSTACLRANLKIGRNCTNGNYFNGKIDDVRIYNRALSAGEIKKLYLMGR